MAYPKKQIMKDVVLAESTTSVATTPVAAVAVAPISGTIVKVVAAVGGTTTGTTTVAVTVNASATDIAGGSLAIAAGSNARAGVAVDLGKTNAGAVTVAEGDIITFTPSGGTGASIPGAFVAVIRP